MKATWCRVSTTLFDRDQRPGTVTVFFDYDLRCWLFGVSLDPDPSWYDLKFSFGPIGLSLNYWRRQVYLLS